MKEAIAIVCYANKEVVENTISKALNLGVKLFLVDNHSPDERTREYLNELEDNFDSTILTVLRPDYNLGCHRGFDFAFKYILKHNPEVEILVKCDDDTVPPMVNWFEMESLFGQYPKLAMVGTNFFTDGRVDNAEYIYLNHGSFSTKFCPWNDIINIPVGYIRSTFYRLVGLQVAYQQGNGDIITDDDHLYGGEEAYLSQMANKIGYTYGYLVDYKAEMAPNELLDPDYILWKYMYGYQGSIDCDFAVFKNNGRLKFLGYDHWYNHSENGMHKQWAKEFLMNHEEKM